LLKVVFVCKDCSFVSESEGAAKGHAETWNYDGPGEGGRHHRVVRFEKQGIEH
jgi:hypothetical protein